MRKHQNNFYSAVLVSLTFATQLLMPAFVQGAPEVLRAVNYDQAPDPGLFRAETLDLNGAWKISFGDDPSKQNLTRQIRSNDNDSQIIQVPFAPQAELSGISHLKNNLDILWYEKDILLPADWQGGLLNFEGVDYEAEIYFNGKFMGEHRGGYDPIKVDVSSAIRFGKVQANGFKSHRITLRAKDSTTARDQLVGKQERKEDEGVIFYTNSSGIFKPVSFERIGKTYIRDLTIDTNAKGQLNIKTILGGRVQEAKTLRVTVRLENQSKIALTAEVAVGAKDISLDAILKDAKLWSPDKPNLYFMDVEVLDANGKVLDKVKSYTGFRTFEQRAGYFYLNGKVFYQQGILDQAIYDRSLYTPTEEAMIRDITWAKKAGFNMVRYHQTTPTKRRCFLEARLGIGSTRELPSARDLRDPKAFKEAMRQWKNILQAYAFNPAVLWVVPLNEDWGMLEDDDHWAPASTEVREKLQWQAYKATIEAAPQNMLVSIEDGWRTVTAVKNGQPIVGVDANRIIVGIHDYRRGEDLFNNYRDLTVEMPNGSQLPRGGKEAFLQGYEHRKDTAILLSEFSGLGFTTGEGKVFVYGEPFADAQSWGKATVETIVAAGRAPVFHGGYVITQMRDAGNNPRDLTKFGEINGLLTADGKDKVPIENFIAANETARKFWLTNYNQYQQHLKAQSVEQLNNVSCEAAF